MLEKLYFPSEIKQRGGVQRGGGHTESRRKPTPGGSDLCAHRRSKEVPHDIQGTVREKGRERERERESVRACVTVWEIYAVQMNVCRLNVRESAKKPKQTA